jgi:hypothetical protein
MTKKKPTKSLKIRNSTTEFMLFTAYASKDSIEVRVEEDTVWLTQKAMAKLFGVDVRTVSEHLGNIFQSEELQEESVLRKFRITAADNKQYNTQFYNLDAIISVGYRVNSLRATQFRQWATRILKEFAIKGFVLDDERLKQGKTSFGKDYFEELLERIREIRASERRFYQKITDIYALAADYDKNAPITKDFFATVQNKLHWAITGKTAAELIYDSADAEKIYMGLTNWKQAPEGLILTSDVAIAKNYLNKAHIEELNRIVSAYLDLAENQAKRQLITRMEEWAQFLIDFLELSKYPILQDEGRVSALEAKLKAEQEFEEYRVVQDKNYISDFDVEIKRFLGNKKE